MYILASNLGSVNGGSAKKSPLAKVEGTTLPGGWVQLNGPYHSIRSFF